MKVAIVYTGEVPGTFYLGCDAGRQDIIAVQNKDGLWEIPGQERIKPFSISNLATVQLLDTEQEGDILSIIHIFNRKHHIRID